MHVFPWKSSTSARFKRAQARTCGRGGVAEWIESSTTHRRSFSLSLSLFLFVCPAHTRTSSVSIRRTNAASSPAFLFLFLERSYLSIRLTLLQKPPSLSSRPMHLEEMCLYLDSGQIICGNKFLCVQCYVIGFISLPTSIYVYVYISVWYIQYRIPWHGAVTLYFHPIPVPIDRGDTEWTRSQGGTWPCSVRFCPGTRTTRAT